MTSPVEQAVGNLSVPAPRPPRRDVQALAAHLAADPHFADCDYADTEALVRAGTVVSVPAHWVFLRQGTPAHGLYVLITGRAGIYRGRTKIADVGPGDIVGELALASGGQRTATVASSEPVKALRVDTAVLPDLLARHPRLQRLIADVGRARTLPAA